MPSQINLFDGLIIDNFAGGGGASTGIELALGRPVDIAINHDKDAIAMHTANHPYTKHYCESVWDIDPRKATNGLPVTLAWFSPDCKHFSKARGGKPADKNIRCLAWVAVRWAAAVRPRVIILENVEEFKTWGPLNDQGQPDRQHIGETFNDFTAALREHGYDVDWRELRACDYGAPTTRKRFFLVARCDEQPITWPTPTHGIGKRLKPYRTAAEIIDWSLPCPSIFDTSSEIRAKYGINAVRPLAEATLRRIARGLQKFVIDNPKPFIMSIGQTGFAADRSDAVKAFLAKYYPGNGAESSGVIANKPLHTTTAFDRSALVTSHVIKFKGDNYGHPINEPLQTITANGYHFGEIRAFLIKYYGVTDGQKITEPTHTVTTKDRLGLVMVHGQEYAITDIGLRMLTPRELFSAQGFPTDYVIDTSANGKPITKAAQVARCGNSVCPPLAEALVRANLPEQCGARFETMQDLMLQMAV
jgi:DNA (cytosine-5)-methyltransferase 1